MTLTPESSALLDMMATLMPVQMHNVPIQTLRESAKVNQVPSSTTIESVVDVQVPSETGGVPVRIYRPTAATGLPVLMWMHGGGFAIGDLDMSDDYLRQLSNASGVVIVSVDYRLAPEHPYPAPLDDCVTVWTWLQSGPDEVGGDLQRIAVGGESAGGSLAFALALRVRDEGGVPPVVSVTAYGTVDMVITNAELGTPPLLTAADCEWFWDMYAPDEDQRAQAYCNPARAASVADQGPALVMTAGFDPTRDATEAYARRMEAEGVDVTLRRYEGVPHGFLTMLGMLPESKQSFDDVVAFLKAKL